MGRNCPSVRIKRDSRLSRLTGPKVMGWGGILEGDGAQNCTGGAKLRGFKREIPCLRRKTSRNCCGAGRELETRGPRTSCLPSCKGELLAIARRALHSHPGVAHKLDPRELVSEAYLALRNYPILTSNRAGSFSDGEGRCATS